jgi:peptidyl-prolyl cis-trans isomerase A (cyclophilin A)
MRSILAAGILGVFLIQVAGCPNMMTEGTTQGAKFTTSKGEFVVKLELEKAPVTVGNFMQYVKDGFYNGTIFHRVVPSFMIQGGGYTSDMTLKQVRSSIINESGNGLSNVRGTIAMARGDAPDSAEAQFFINVADNKQLDSTVTTPGYTVFGEVTQGMDIVDQIAAVPTQDQLGFSNLPVDPVTIQSIELVDVPSGVAELTAQGQDMVQQQQYQAMLFVRQTVVSLLQFALSPR